MGNLTYELPTYELRARLDKLGVEWTYANGTVRFNDGRRWFRAWAYNDDLLCVSMGYLTPEQAIAATVGNAREPSDSVIERIERFCTDYAQCLINSTILSKRNHEFVDRRAAEKAEVVEADLIRELAEDIATVGAGTCNMEPDGYYGEQYGIYKCSNCGELWQFDCDGPKEHGWTCCPKCQAIIKED